MKSKYILLALVIAVLSSCSSAYKIGQTPDDVYFSPTPAQNEYVQVSNNDDRNTYDDASYDDRDIRRRVNSRISRRLPLDYGYDYPYSFGYNSPYAYDYYNYPYSYGYNSYNNYQYGYYPPVYGTIKTPTSALVYRGPRKSNLGTYSVAPLTPGARTRTFATNPVNTSPVRTFNRPAGNTRTGVGNFIRKVISNPGQVSSPRNNDNTQTRTFEPARSTTTSSPAASAPSSSSGGNAPVRSFNR